jgi:hypothetical protein
MLTSRSTLNAQCANLPVHLASCLTQSTSYQVIGDPNAETNISDWIASSCILPNSTAATTAQFILVIGDIRFDVDYTFATGSDVVVDSMKRFVQTAGISVGVYGTSIRGCEYMWREWLVESNISATASLEILDSEISDAVHGFRLQPESVFGVMRTEFINNRIAIRTDDWNCDNLFSMPATPLADYYINPGICDNIFTAPSLKPPFSGKGYSGILVEAINNIIDIGIGLGCMGNNEFSDYFYGINACNVVNMNLANSVFRDIGSVTSPSGEACVFFASHENSGIPCFLDQQGIGLLMPTIQNSVNGITVFNADAVIQDNLVSNVFDGFNWTYGKNRFVQITDNIINDYEGNGIYAFNSVPMDITIQDNQIVNLDNTVNTGFFDFGIYLSGLMVPNIAQNLSVRENTLLNQKTSSNQGYFGIYSFDNDRGQYGNNLVEDQSSGLSTFVGMNHLRNSRGQVGYNSILANTTTALSSGLLFNISPRMQVFCNFTDGTTDGLQFFENCDDAVIRNNEMNNHDSGLFYSSPMTITDIQDNRANRWPFMTSTVEANWPGADPSFIPLSRYYVFSTATDQWPNPLNPSSWFQVQGVQGPPCHQTHPGGGGGDRSSEWDDEWIPRLTTANMALLEQNLEVPSGQDGRLFDYRADLFRLLLDYPELQNDHPNAPAYFIDMEGTPSGLLVKAESRLEEVFLLNEQSKLSLQSLSDELALGQNDWRDLQATLDFNMSKEEQNQILDQLRLLSTANQVIVSNIQNLRSDITSDQIEEAEQLLGELNAIVPVETTEEDLKTVLILKVTDKLNGVTLKWTADELQTLETIAAKCPFVAGRSVYYARNLLGQDKTWQLIEDDPMCGIIEGQFGKASSTDNPEAGSWTTYPSPTSDAIWLKHDQILTADFKLFNSQGLIVAEGEVQPARPIMVSHLPDGFYWINIRDKATLIVQTLPIQILR